MDKKSVGRPQKYENKDTRDEAMKAHRKKWYEENKQKIKETRNPEKERENRLKKVFKGYFMLYSEKEAFFGYSKDVSSRCRNMMNKIKNKEENGFLISKFDKEAEYQYKILEFSDSKCVDKLNKISNEFIEKNPSLKRII